MLGRSWLAADVELSASIEFLFAEGDVDRAAWIDRAAAAGLTMVEMWTVADDDVPALSAALERTGIALRATVTEPLARIADPSTHAAFVAGVDRSAGNAARLGCPYVVVIAGDAVDGVPADEQRRAVVEALRAAAPVAAGHGVTLLLEPLNRGDHPRHLLDGAVQALDIVEAVGEPSLRLNYDLYHSSSSGERPRDVLDGRVDLVAHVQVADVPGRHEPGTGTIDWASELGWLLEQGYAGALGLEYRPSMATGPSMAHLRQVLSSL